MMSEGLAEGEWIRGVWESAVYRDCDRRPCTDDFQFILLPTVTVMKADSAIHLDASIVCTVNATSACDHLIRESFGCHCRRTAEELCVLRRKHMQAFRAKCRWVPDSMIADALTKQHGNSVTTLKFVKRSTLGIQDEVKELANLRQFQQEHGRNPPTNRQHEDEAAEAVEWSRRLAVRCSKSIPIDPDLEAESLATLGQSRD